MLTRKTCLQLVAAIGVIPVLAGTARSEGSFDGTYAGHMQTTIPCSSRWTLQGRPVTIVILDNKLSFQYWLSGDTAHHMSANLADDGTFHAEGVVLVDGYAQRFP
jgi:hypothetical protein